MNPISKIKQHNHALTLLHDAGYDGDLVQATVAALTLSDQMAQHLADYNKLADQLTGAVVAADGKSGVGLELKTYFVPYLFEATEYANGGKIKTGSGMTMVHVAGGIRNWKGIVGLIEFIRQTNLAPMNLPNARVTIMGLDEIPNADLKTT